MDALVQTRIILYQVYLNILWPGLPPFLSSLNPSFQSAGREICPKCVWDPPTFLWIIVRACLTSREPPARQTSPAPSWSGRPPALFPSPFSISVTCHPPLWVYTPDVLCGNSLSRLFFFPWILFAQARMKIFRGPKHRKQLGRPR